MHERGNASSLALQQWPAHPWSTTGVMVAPSEVVVPGRHAVPLRLVAGVREVLGVAARDAASRDERERLRMRLVLSRDSRMRLPICSERTGSNSDAECVGGGATGVDARAMPSRGPRFFFLAAAAASAAFAPGLRWCASCERAPHAPNETSFQKGNRCGA